MTGWSPDDLTMVASLASRVREMTEWAGVPLTLKVHCDNGYALLRATPESAEVEITFE